MITDNEKEIIINGLGEVENGDELNALARRPANQAAMVNQIKQNESGASRRRKVALDTLKTLNMQLFNEITQGKRQLSDKVYYTVRRCGGNTVKLFVEDRNKQVGLTNATTAKVDHPFIALGVKLEFANVPKINPTDVDYPKEFTKPFSDRFSDLGISTEQEARIMNGEYQLRKNGRDIVEKQPISQLMPKNKDYSTNGDGVIEFDNPKFYYPNETMEFNMDFPDGIDQALVAKVSFYGIEFRP